MLSDQLWETQVSSEESHFLAHDICLLDDAHSVVGHLYIITMTICTRTHCACTQYVVHAHSMLNYAHSMFVHAHSMSGQCYCGCTHMDAAVNRSKLMHDLWLKVFLASNESTLGDDTADIFDAPDVCIHTPFTCIHTPFSCTRTPFTCMYTPLHACTRPLHACTHLIHACSTDN